MVEVEKMPYLDYIMIDDKTSFFFVFLALSLDFRSGCGGR